MPVAGKMKLTIHVDPENVEYIRSQWSKRGDSERGIGRLIDAYLAELVKKLKAGKSADKESLILKPL